MRRAMLITGMIIIIAIGVLLFAIAPGWLHSWIEFALLMGVSGVGFVFFLPIIVIAYLVAVVVDKRSKTHATQLFLSLPFDRSIFGIIEVEYKGWKDYNLFFTSNNMIVGRITREELKLKHISQGNILAADEKNFAIPYSDIVKVEMKKPRRLWLYAGKIDVVTDKKTHKFIIKGVTNRKKSFNDSLNLMRSVLPDKLSVS